MRKKKSLAESVSGRSRPSTDGVPLKRQVDYMMKSVLLTPKECVHGQLRLIESSRKTALRSVENRVESTEELKWCSVARSFTHLIVLAEGGVSDTRT